MSSRDWKRNKGDKKLPPLYGGAGKKISYVRMGHRDLYINPEDIYNEKFTFKTDDEFKYIVSYYLDAVRRRKGVKVKQLAKNLGKAESAVPVMKFDGVSTFELFLRYCFGLSLDPELAFKNCMELYEHFRNK